MSADLLSLDALSPGRNLGAYVQTVNSIPILTREEERELAERFYYEDDVEAARRLVMSHLRFVVHVARGYSGYGLAQGDLIQEGTVGLMKAVKRFNPEFDVRLVSFAVHWIKAEIHEFVLRNWRIVKVATTKAQRKLFFNLRSAKKRLGWLSPDEASVVAEALDVSPEAVVQMEGRLAAHDAAFDGYASDDDDLVMAPAQYLEDAEADPALLVAETDWMRRSTDCLAEAIEALDPRSQDILRSRWMTEEKATLHELGAKYDVSAERIRQIEKNAMKKLRLALESQ